MRKNFFYTFLLTGSNLLFPLLTFPYLSRILGAEGLGICNFILSYGQNYTIIAGLGIPIYGIREIAKAGNDEKKRSKLFFELLIIHFISTGFFLIIYLASIFMYDDLRDYKDLALLGGTLILFNVFSIEWLFTGISEFKYITVRSLIIRGFSVISIFIFVKNKDDFFIYILTFVVTIFLTIVLDVRYSTKFISRKVVLSFRGTLAHIKPIAFLGIYMILTSVYSVLPTTLLGFLSTKVSVGYYFGANKIIRVVISVFSSLITVMIPRLNVSVEKEEFDKYLMLVNQSLKVVISFGLPITFFVFLLARPLVMLLGGENFNNSIVVVQIMSPVILLVSFAQIFVFLVLSVNRKDKQMVLLSVIGMTISIIINLLLIPLLAERATGISQLMSELAVTLIAFFIAKKIVNFHFPIKLFILNLICLFPFILVTYLFSQLFESNILIITFSATLCGLYFILYQIFIIKDVFLLQLIEPYLFKLRISRLNNSK